MGNDFPHYHSLIPMANIALAIPSSLSPAVGHRSKPLPQALLTLGPTLGAQGGDQVLLARVLPSTQTRARHWCSFARRAVAKCHTH